jgi:hypothetical protein
MQTASDAYREQVKSGSQPPAVRARFDWLKNGVYTEAWVDSVSVERTLTSDFPEEVTQITGVAAAVATVGLTGDPNDNTRTAAWLYSPYQPQSPLYGVDTEDAPAVVELGQVVNGEPARFPVIRGRARDLVVSAAADGTAGSVQIVDGRTDLSFKPVLPLIVAADKAGGLQPGLNSQFIADAVFRQGGYYASPPPGGGLASPRQMLSVPMHGSAWPDTLPRVLAPETLVQAATAAGGPIRFAPLRWGLGTQPDPVDGSLGTMEYTLPAPQMTYTLGVYVEMWIRPSVVSYPLGDVTFRDDANAIGTRIRLGNNGANYVLRLADSVDVTGPAVTAPTAAHYLAVHAYIFGGTLTVKWRVDGVTTTSAPIANPLSTGSGVYHLLVKTYNAIEALQVIDRSPYGLAGLEPPWVDGFVPSAVIEPGENELIAMPPMAAGDDGWSVLQALATAEAALVLLDEPGIAQFWSRKHWGTAPAANTVQQTIRASVPLLAASVQRLARRVRNVIRVPYAPVAVQPLSVIWALSTSDLVIVPAFGSASRNVDLSPVQVYRVDTLGGVIPSGGALAWGHSGYRACRYNPVAGTFGAQAIISMLVAAAVNSIDISWFNSNPWPVALVTPATGYPASSVGLPTAAVVGQLITSAAPAPDSGEATPAVDTAVAVSWQPSIDVYGQRPLDLPASAWRQTAGVATSLGQDLLHDTAWPGPQLSSVTVAGDATRQMGDRVLIEDDTGSTGLADPYWIVDKSDKCDGGDNATYTQDLKLRPVARPGQLILGVVGRSELGGPKSQL